MRKFNFILFSSLLFKFLLILLLSLLVVCPEREDEKCKYDWILYSVGQNRGYLLLTTQIRTIDGRSKQVTFVNKLCYIGLFGAQSMYFLSIGLFKIVNCVSYLHIPYCFRSHIVSTKNGVMIFEYKKCVVLKQTGRI